MPQPQPNESDPLLAFFEEQEKPADPVQLTDAAKDPPVGDLRMRVERTERQIERALIDISTLKSDQAKLVSAVEDIRRQLSRPAAEKPAPVVARPVAQKGPRLRTVAAILVLIALGAAAWGLTPTMTDELPEPPPIESESSNIIASPPIVEAQPPIAPVAARSPVTSPAPSARVVSYVGTLTIDAEPAGNVFVNRESAGRTPLRLNNLRAGSHLIWIERDGYRRWTRVVAVTADRVSRVSASLDPISR